MFYVVSLSEGLQYNTHKDLFIYHSCCVLSQSVYIHPQAALFNEETSHSQLCGYTEYALLLLCNSSNNKILICTK